MVKETTERERMLQCLGNVNSLSLLISFQTLLFLLVGYYPTKFQSIIQEKGNIQGQPEKFPTLKNLQHQEYVTDLNDSNSS